MGGTMWNSLLNLVSSRSVYKPGAVYRLRSANDRRRPFAARKATKYLHTGVRPRASVCYNLGTSCRSGATESGTECIFGARSVQHGARGNSSILSGKVRYYSSVKMHMAYAYWCGTILAALPQAVYCAPSVR